MMETSDLDAAARKHLERPLKLAPEDSAARELQREIEARPASEEEDADELELPQS